MTGQKPFFRIFRESGSPNAYASNQPYGGYRNSILFGENMLEQSIQDVTVFSQGEWEEGTDYSGVAAILMHEYTHLVEFDQGLHVHNSVKSLELLSDMMAGWMFGNRIETHAENLPELENHILNSAAEKMFALGDYYFNHSDHHGTPAERMNAFWTGYELNKSGYNSYFSAFNRAKTILNILE